MVWGMGGEESPSLPFPNDFQTIAYWPRADPALLFPPSKERECAAWSFVRMIMMDRGGRTKREREVMDSNEGGIRHRDDKLICKYCSFQATAQDSKGEYFSLHAVSREKSINVEKKR